MLFVITISALAFLLYLQTGIFIIWANSKSNINRWFFAISVYLAVWIIIYLYALQIDLDKDSIRALMRPGWAFFPFMLYRFHALLLWVPGSRSYRKILSVFFFLAGLFVFFAFILSEFITTSSVNPGSQLLFYADCFFIGLFVFLGIAIIAQLYFWRQQLPHRKERIRFTTFLQALIIFQLFAIYFLFHYSANHIVNFFNKPFIFLLPWYLFIAYGSVRYRFFLENPAMSESDLIDELQRIFFICDIDARVLLSNQYTAKLLNKPKNELKGSDVVSYFLEKDLAIAMIDDAGKKGDAESVELSFAMHSNMSIPVSASCVLLKDRFGDKYGYAIFCKDNREAIALRNENSKREESEAALMTLQMSLGDEVEKRTHDLRLSVEAVRLKIEERLRDEELIMLEISEKEIMLKEIHTRVQKNISMILLLLDADSYPKLDAADRAQMKKLFQRVNSIYLLNKQMFTFENYGMVDFKRFLELLVDGYLAQPLRNPAPEINLKADNLYLWIDEAVPLSIVAQELIYNALNHAFIDDKQSLPRLQIEYSVVSDTSCSLLVKDNGCGLDFAGYPQHNHISGLQLVEILVREQLNGTIEIKNDHGTSAVVTVPINELRRGHHGLGG